MALKSLLPKYAVAAGSRNRRRKRKLDYSADSHALRMSIIVRMIVDKEVKSLVANWCIAREHTMLIGVKVTGVDKMSYSNEVYLGVWMRFNQSKDFLDLNSRTLTTMLTLSTD